MSIANYTDRERALLADCERLTAELDNIKQVEFPKRLRNVTKPIIAQRDALQAKITVLEGHAHAGLLEAFDAYARQFTYNSHPAKPEHFPKSFPWFSAGYAAAGAAPVPQGRKITTTRIANHLKKSPLGDISMYRNGFFDGAKWAAKEQSCQNQ